MRVFARRVEHPLDVTVYRSHDADARKHRWPVMFSTGNNACIAACHSSASCSALGSFVMYCAASRSVTSGFRLGNMIGSKTR
jgi:hypothetical protein